MDKSVFMFSGQGSHYYNMGRALYQQQDSFRYHFDRLNGTFNEQSGFGLSSKLFVEGSLKRQSFDRLIYSHPAIVMVELSLAYTLIDHGVVPDTVVGSSLGEFSAMAVAGIINDSDAIYYAYRQADLIEKQCAESAMIAVLSPVDIFHSISSSCDNFKLIAVNGNEAFVLAAPSESVGQLDRWLRDNKVANFKLPVKYGFHTHLINEAEATFKDEISTLNLKPPQTQFLSSVFVETMDCVYNNYLWDVVRQPIQFSATARAFLSSEGLVLYDLGQSGTLSTICKQSLGDPISKKLRTIMLPMGCDNTRINNILN